MVAVAALVAGIAATAAALQGRADAGVVPDLAGGIVESVSPTGFAWKVGIRPGQSVVNLAASSDAGGWRLETEAAGHHYVVAEAPYDAALAGSLPLGILATFAGGFSILFLGTRRRWVLPAASAAFLAASIPLDAQGIPGLSTAALGGAALIPSLWLAGRLRIPRPLRAGLAIAAVGFLAAWVVARLSAAGSYDVSENIRGAVATWGTAALLLDRFALPIVAGEPIRMSRPSILDVATVAGLAGLALALMYVFSVPPLVVGLVLLIALLARPTVRRVVGVGFGNTILADLREQAAAAGAEEERGRLAREIHDAPLQQLAGIIRRLELVPEAGGEANDLRLVAGQLRTVAADLRPPVLDDLGLGAAIQTLTDDMTVDDVSLLADIEDQTALDVAHRPPSDVEFALYRITQEAVTNALRHAGASEIRITGSIAPDRIELAIADNGIGFDPNRPHTTGERRGLGLGSMRRRAQAIDAEYSIESSAHGTSIQVSWER